MNQSISGSNSQSPIIIFAFNPQTISTIIINIKRKIIFWITKNIIVTNSYTKLIFVFNAIPDNGIQLSRNKVTTRPVLILIGQIINECKNFLLFPVGSIFHITALTRIIFIPVCSAIFNLFLCPSFERRKNCFYIILHIITPFLKNQQYKISSQPSSRVGT